MEEKLYIIDSNSPFFADMKKKIINWSKLPYNQFENKRSNRKSIHFKIRKYFKRYINKIVKIGYNAISFDDLCHLIFFDFYPERLKKRILIYRKYFYKLFMIATGYKLKIFITTDVVFYNKYIHKFSKGDRHKILNLLYCAIKKLFNDFNCIDGVIFRIGESDGADVKGDFKSRLFIKTPEQTNQFIKAFLPLFEKYGKKMIFRTWTIGINRIGDLMWNEKSFARSFRNIKSDHFILSMKYGQTDFFRYQDLNRHFKIAGCKKIIELQSRREYEGFGEFPCFTGWEYHKYFLELEKESSLCGIHVWCQTGGWSSFRNFTFLKKTSFWNELNTFVTLHIFKNGITVEEAVKKYSNGRFKTGMLIKFLKMSDAVISNLLYDPGFSSQSIYFNRVKLPPLIHIFWDNVTITDQIVALYNHFNKQKDQTIKSGKDALLLIGKMNRIGKELGLKYDFNFYFDTFRLFAACRELIYSPHKEEILRTALILIRKYKKKYPGKYKFYIYLNLKKRQTFFIKLIFTLVFRKRAKYRFVDHILFNKFTFPFYKMLFRLMRRNFPLFINNRAMPLGKLLR